MGIDFSAYYSYNEGVADLPLLFYGSSFRTKHRNYMEIYYEVLSMGPKRLVLTLAIRYAYLLVQLRIAKVKTSLLGPIDSTS